MSGTETDEQTWPPPPERDDPMTEHTEFLTALLRTPAPKPLTRLRLYRALQQETGMERHYCWLTVRHFCERHDIFPGVRGLRLWLLFTPSLVAMTVAVATPFVMLRLIRMHDAAPTAVARRAITGEVFGLVELDGVSSSASCSPSCSLGLRACGGDAARTPKPGQRWRNKWQRA